MPVSKQLSFDISILRENLLLDETQSASRRAMIVSQRGSMNCLISAISSLEGELRDLERRQYFDQALLAPVRRVPAEVLGEIFKHCVASDSDHSPCDATVAPMLLTGVCHRWRQVAHGTPEIWTDLKIFGHRFEAWYLRGWFQYSGSLLLNLRLDLVHNHLGRRCSFDELDEWRGTSNYSEIIQSISAQRHRTRRLVMIGPRNVIGDIVGAEQPRNFESLEDLHVGCTSPDNRAVGMCHLEIPKLRTLSISGTAIPITAFEPSSRLRRLNVTGTFSAIPFINFLSLCSAGIEEITAEFFRFDSPYPPHDFKCIVLSNLLLLDVHWHTAFNWDEGGLLQSICAPTLRDIAVDNFPDEAHILCTFLVNASSSLRRLSIRHTKISSNSHFPGLMRALTEIESLDVDEQAADRVFWETLTPREDGLSAHWISPKLTSITFKVGWRTSHDVQAAFIRFIERRAPPAVMQEGFLSGDAHCLTTVDILGLINRDSRKALRDLKDNRQGLFITGLRYDDDDEKHESPH